MEWTRRWTLAAITSAVGVAGGYLKASDILSLFSKRASDYFSSSGAAMPFYDIIQPQARYLGDVDSTVIVWQGGSVATFVTEYNHASGEWEPPVRIGKHPEVADFHGGPALVRDSSGYLHVFYGSHGSDQLYARSDFPNDINSWTKQSAFTGEFTYPKPARVNGNLHLFMRRRDGSNYNVETHRRSTNGGDTWSSGNAIIDYGSGYTIYTGGIAVDGSDVHLAWVLADQSVGKRLNVYHAIFDTSTEELRSIDGTNLGTTVTQSEGDNSCKVFDSGNQGCGTARIKFDDTGTPYVFFKYNDPTDGWVLKWTEWDGSAWTIPETIADVGHQYNSHEEIVRTVSDMEAFVTYSASADRAGDMQRWTYDGTSWSLSETIRKGSEGVGVNNPQIVHNHQSTLRMVFAEEDHVDLDNGDLKLFAYGNNGFVTNSR